MNASSRWRRMDRILLQVLDAPEPERPRLLAELAGKDRKLRAAVETRLREAEQEDSVLDRRSPLQGALGMALARELSGAPGSRRAASREIVSGTRLGHYEIRGRLGGGGMGDVYRARDARLGREVALKVLSQVLAGDPEGQARFQREARTASCLSHPNIVAVYDVGEQDDAAYIAMELVEGSSLRELLAGGALALRQLVALAAQIAEGIAAAHAAGVVHRDLKPGNVMVGARGDAKIVDFGLAKFALAGDDAAGASHMHTTPGTILGTVSYMSPEQAAGQPAGIAADQFSLGVILYEMATGLRPFDRATRVETLSAILRETPAPVEELRADLPAPLVWAIQRCLAKDPADRYATTADLARDLAAVAQHLGRHQASPIRAPSRPLPGTRSRLIGREREAGDVQQAIRDGARLVTLTGPGGSGKTRLAQKVAAELASSMRGGVYFVELAALNDPRLVLPSVCEALGLRTEGDDDHLAALAQELGAPARPATLLVLDNFEHLLDAGARIAKLVRACPCLSLLVTSREVLHVYDEREYPVPPLPAPPDAALPLEVVSQYPAVELFVERARAVRPDFRLTEHNAAAVAEVCRRLDGLPLALELAAARVKLLTAEAMLKRLASRLELAAGAIRDRPRRQQTLAASIAWSYELLAPEEQALFSRLAVFVGGFTLEGAEAVANAMQDLPIRTADGVSSLLDKSLLQLDPSSREPRFRMLETVREYALGRLEASEVAGITRKAHAAWCLVLAEEFSSRPNSADAEGRLAQIDPELDNIRCAQDWLLQAREAEWSLRLSAALLNYHALRDSVSEGRARLAAVLDAFPRQGDPRLLGRILFNAGWFALEQGDLAEARARTLEALQAAVDWQGKVVALVGLGAVCQRAGDLGAARKLYTASVELCRASPQPETAAQALLNLANVARLEGQLAEARSLLSECQRVFETTGSESGLALVLSQLADVARDEGLTQEAVSLYGRSLGMFRRLGDQREVGNRLGELGRIEISRGHDEAAGRAFREALQIFHALGARRHTARALDWLAILATRQGRPERCLRLAGAAAAWQSRAGIEMAGEERQQLLAALRSSREALAHKAGEVWMEGWSAPQDRIVEWALDG